VTAFLAVIYLSLYRPLSPGSIAGTRYFDR
jgi:hypothetical protein